MQVHSRKTEIRSFARLRRFLLFGLAVLFLSLSIPAGAYARPYDDPSLYIFKENGKRDYDAEMAERKLLPVESNQRSNWPIGPMVGAGSVCLMDAETGMVLYDKNMHAQYYPASTTKLLTCLIAVEELPHDTPIPITANSVACLGNGASNIGMDIGQVLTFEEALYGILVGSANEVSAAVAEAVSGSLDAFAQRMNERAAELGCTDSHYMNSNGLFHEDHYTSAYDLAIIARAFFNNDLLRRIGNTADYHFIPSATQPDDFYIHNKHRLITGEVACEGVIGGKTGYTDASRETLVTGCERNGTRLICVVMKEEMPYQFTDTVSLFDYGFNQFRSRKLNASDILPTDNAVDFLTSGHDLMGNSAPLFELTENSAVVLPTGYELGDLEQTIVPAPKDSGLICTFQYSLGGIPMGEASLRLISGSSDTDAVYRIQRAKRKNLPENELTSLFTERFGKPYYVSDSGTLFINVKIMVGAIALLGFAAILIISFIAFIGSFVRPMRRRRRRRRR